jgi:hypothetical protein
MKAEPASSDKHIIRRGHYFALTGRRDWEKCSTVLAFGLPSLLGRGSAVREDTSLTRRKRNTSSLALLARAQRNCRRASLELSLRVSGCP